MDRAKPFEGWSNGNRPGSLPAPCDMTARKSASLRDDLHGLSGQRREDLDPHPRDHEGEENHLHTSRNERYHRRLVKMVNCRMLTPTRLLKASISESRTTRFCAW